MRFVALSVGWRDHDLLYFKYSVLCNNSLGCYFETKDSFFDDIQTFIILYEFINFNSLLPLCSNNSSKAGFRPSNLQFVNELFLTFPFIF